MILKKIRVYKQINEKIKQAKNIALISHILPDPDTIWSWLAIYSIIKENFLYKNVDLICQSDIPKSLNFLKNIDKYKTDFNPKNYDLIIFVDTSSPDLTWLWDKYKELFDKNTYNTISTDHHITNTLFAKQNILNVTYSSTTMIIWEIFFLLWYKITPNIRTYLLLWIYTDTWWFKHSNTTKETYFIASKLIYDWWDIKLIIDKIFKKNKLSKIKLYWEIISNSYIDENNILYAYVNQTMLDIYNLSYEDAKWVLDLLNSIENIKYTVFLTQKWDYIKWSLRTLRDDIDLTLVASKYWWWWHKKASWFSLEWTLEQKTILNFKI